MHLLADFNQRSYADFAAGEKYSLILLDGPGGTASDALYQHELPGGKKS